MRYPSGANIIVDPYDLSTPVSATRVEAPTAQTDPAGGSTAWRLQETPTVDGGKYLRYRENAFIAVAGQLYRLGATVHRGSGDRDFAFEYYQTGGGVYLRVEFVLTTLVATAKTQTGCRVVGTECVELGGDWVRCGFDVLLSAATVANRDYYFYLTKDGAASWVGEADKYLDVYEPFIYALTNADEETMFFEPQATVSASASGTTAASVTLPSVTVADAVRVTNAGPNTVYAKVIAAGTSDVADTGDMPLLAGQAYFQPKTGGGGTLSVVCGASGQTATVYATVGCGYGGR